MKRLLSAAALAAMTLSARSAGASPADLYGGSARAMGTAGTMTTADDASAAHYNPAGLGAVAESGRAQIQVGYGAGVPLTWVERARQDSAVETRLPGWQGWATGAFAIPITGGALKDRLALGMVFFHPQDKLVKVQSLDPKYPQFYRYQANPDRLVIALGAGWSFGKRFSIGVGAHVLGVFDGQVNFKIELFERRVEQRDLDLQLRTTPTPTAGIVWQPTDQWRIGLSARGPLELALSLPTTIGLGDIGTLELIVHGVMHYTPAQVALGVQFQPNEDWKLAADLKVSMWQFAPGPGVNVRVNLRGEIPEGLGLDEALSFGTNDGSPGFIPEVSPSLAAEWRMPDRKTIVRFGYALRPTFVPDQQGSTNLLDNTHHVVGTGASFSFLDPTGIFPGPLKLDLAAQAAILQPRSVKKDRANDAVSDLSFGGVVLATSAALRYEF